MIDNSKIELSSENENLKPDYIINEAPGKTFEEMSFKEYQIQGEDNQIYDLKIFQTQKSISFYVKEKSELNEKKYKKEIILEEFYNINKFFRQYLSLEELFNNLFKNLKNTEITLSENNNQIKLGLIIECRGDKEEIYFILEQDQTEIDNLIFNLCEEIKKLQIQKTLNENIIKEYNEIKNNLDNNNKKKFLFFPLTNFEKFFILWIVIQIIIFIYMKNEINRLKNNIIKLKIPSNNNNKIINSKIIDNDELYLIEDEIQKIYNKNISKYELLFRASKDGFRATDFHNKCDGENNTLILVKTTNGRRFGGFTDFPWNNKNINRNGEKEFTFSLDNEKVYNFEANNNNIYNNVNSNSNWEGPNFGGKYGFKLCDSCDTYSSSQDYSYSYSYDYNYNRYQNNKNYGLAENSNFLVKDYEVFKIYF